MRLPFATRMLTVSGVALGLLAPTSMPAATAPLSAPASAIEAVADGVPGTTKVQRLDRNRHLRPHRRHMRRHRYHRRNKAHRFRYNRHRHGRRYHHRRPGYHYYHDGFWYRSPFWLLPFFAGAIFF